MDKSVESNKEGEPNKMVEFDSSPPSHGPPAPPHVTNNGTHYQPPHHGSHNHPHHHHSFFDRIKRFFGFPTPSPHCRGPPPPPRHHRQHEGRNSTEPTPELEGIQVEMIENEMEINNQTHHHGDHHCGPAPPHQHRKSFLKKSSNKISEFFEDLSFTSYVLLLFASKMVLVSGIVGIIKTIKKRNNGEIQLKEEKAPGILPE